MSPQTQTPDSGATTASADWFEAIYAEAGGNATTIPWAAEKSNPALVNWLNAIAPSLIRCGARVCVVGCGLGDDAMELAKRGYDVTAFDVSPTAIDWARKRDRTGRVDWHVADLFDLPARWRHRFDLVVEISTVQALPIDQRDDTVRAIADLVSPHGYVLVICRGCDEPVEADHDGPPWPLTEDELLRHASLAGLEPHEQSGGVTSFTDDETPPIQRMRAVFRRAGR